MFCYEVSQIFAHRNGLTRAKNAVSLEYGIKMWARLD